MKCIPSTKLVSYEDDVVLYEDEVDNKMKKYGTLNEWRICHVKVGTQSSPTLSSLKNKGRYIS